MDIQRPESRQPLPPHAKRVFEGDIFDVYQWEQELYDGSKITFEKIKRDDTVVVIPVLQDRRILIERDEQPGRSAITTFPAGRMDKEGEDPLSAAKRELREETGYESDEWSLWRAFQPVTKIDWAIYIFVARNCRKAGEPELDAGERISVEAKTFDEVLELAKDPDFVNDDSRALLVEARLDPEARKLLEKTLFG